MSTGPSSITIEMLDKLADEINTYAPPWPKAILMPIQSHFNDQISMQIEAIQRAPFHIPVYRTEFLPILPPAKYLTLRRSQYRTRAAFKHARNYWRWFHREVARKEREMCYIFCGRMEKKTHELTFEAWKHY